MRGWKAKEAAARALQEARETRREIREARQAHIAKLDAAAAEATDKTLIPGDWESLAWPDLKSLASKLSDSPIRTKDEATAAIKAAVEANVAG